MSTGAFGAFLGSTIVKSTLTVLWALAFLSVQVHADEVRPAYLELKAKPGSGYEVVWKQPVVENRRLPIDPIFPDRCELEETAHQS